jgi:hypothetical protein
MHPLLGPFVNLIAVIRLQNPMHAASLFYLFKKTPMLKSWNTDVSVMLKSCDLNRKMLNSVFGVLKISKRVKIEQDISDGIHKL